MTERLKFSHVIPHLAKRQVPFLNVYISLPFCMSAIFYESRIFVLNSNLRKKLGTLVQVCLKFKH